MAALPRETDDISEMSSCLPLGHLQGLGGSTTYSSEVISQIHPGMLSS